MREWRRSTTIRGAAQVGGVAGGYAHLIAAGALYLMFLDGKRDWELAWSVLATP